MLKDASERTLHRLPQTSSRGGVTAWVQDFILTERDEEILTLIELMPVCQYLADEKQRTQGYRYGFVASDLDTERKVERIREYLNKFLEGTLSPARFGKDGHFNREAFAIEVPPVLRELPRQEALYADLGRLLSDTSPVGVIFVDLDDFKSVK